MEKRKPTIIRTDIKEHQATLELKVDADLLDFQGHFTHFPLLPGVTQIDWALHYAIETLNAPRVFKGMEVIKFQEPIRPNMLVTLELTWDSAKQKLAFKYASTRDEQIIVHSSGKMRLGDKSE
ncbi:3-hydroxyacyl-ACP dehydratase [Vibrio sp. MarTm2]|uniref:ApeI family dehydratase n=1 Tax=Vibrio sp. MarTm2 TaxID=2998831 RepID=UPI0022CDA0F0|nr:3-hydroxyacyl-ACP dehydratase [Vibrio sp. MarTm2]MDA0128288.1 3-hydroxyacyl-ACP dehydratase [Vibrio sp. MarTm2]